MRTKIFAMFQSNSKLPAVKDAHADENILEQNAKASLFNEAVWSAICETQVKGFAILSVVFSILVNKFIMV